MENRSRKFRASVILFILAFLIGGIGIFLYFDNLHLIQENEILRAAADSQNADLAGLHEEVDSLKEYLEIVSHIDETIQEKKEECYQLMGNIEQAVLLGETSAKIAYITIDDGPYKTTTPEFLKVLEDKDVRATFFLRNRPDHIEYIQAELAAGHNIGNHSYSHGIKSIYSSENAFLTDFNKQQQWLTDNFGITPQFYRFPGGSSTAKTLRTGIVSALNEEGLGYVDWNCSTGDGGSGPVTHDSAYEKVMSEAEGKKIVCILMHDYNKGTLSALPDIIDSLRADGYLLWPLFPGSSVVKHK